MKRFAVILLALVLLAGCSAEPAVVDLGGKAVTYDSAESMEEAAALVASGTVISCESRINRLGGEVQSALTLSQFEVTEVRKGDVQPGDILSLWQNCAYDDANNTLYQFAGASPVTEGGTYLLYLVPRETGSGFYCPICAQGVVSLP